MKRSRTTTHRKCRRSVSTPKAGSVTMRLQSIGLSVLIHGLLAFGLMRGVQGMVKGWPGNTTLIQSPDRSPAR